MLFSAFTAGSTVAYLTLKGLAPPDVIESASSIVRDSLRLCQDGSESWTLVIPWQRHLSVMSKVLRQVNSTSRDVRDTREDSNSHQHVSPSIKDDTHSQADTNPDMMDYDQMASLGGHPPLPPSVDSRDSEPPVPRRPGVTTINGASVGAATPMTTSPPPGAVPRTDSPDIPSSTSATGIPQAPQPGPDVDMTAIELCGAFERQLLELDDLAAFMGGGV
jgi:hypothetical protein